MKLQLFLHVGETEVGGFGVSAEDNVLYVDDFVTLRQYTTPVTVEFDDAAVAEHFDRCVDQGLTPARFGRIWMHTHPGDSPLPSSTDESTFARVFGTCDWAVMFICSRTGKTYARLNFFAGPGGSLLLPVQVDWAAWPSVLIDQLDTMTATMSHWIQEFSDHIVAAMVPKSRDPHKELGVNQPRAVRPGPDPELHRLDWEVTMDRLAELEWEEQGIVDSFEQEWADTLDHSGREVRA